MVFASPIAQHIAWSVGDVWPLLRNRHQVTETFLGGCDDSLCSNKAPLPPTVVNPSFSSLGAVDVTSPFAVGTIGLSRCIVWGILYFVFPFV
jgi:hypothetical protein